MPYIVVYSCLYGRPLSTNDKNMMTIASVWAGAVPNTKRSRISCSMLLHETLQQQQNDATDRWNVIGYPHICSYSRHRPFGLPLCYHPHYCQPELLYYCLCVSPSHDRMSCRILFQSNADAFHDKLLLSRARPSLTMWMGLLSWGFKNWKFIKHGSHVNVEAAWHSYMWEQIEAIIQCIVIMW